MTKIKLVDQNTGSHFDELKKYGDIKVAIKEQQKM